MIRGEKMKKKNRAYLLFIYILSHIFVSVCGSRVMFVIIRFMRCLCLEKGFFYQFILSISAFAFFFLKTKKKQQNRSIELHSHCCCIPRIVFPFNIVHRLFFIRLYVSCVLCASSSTNS